ncbi:MAG: hypothetical protein K8W52_15280 [Deltaproteobacteria bacterium]|nr:hypothetical protein [Deltaproteobacteria bacterium]
MKVTTGLMMAALCAAACSKKGSDSAPAAGAAGAAPAAATGTPAPAPAAAPVPAAPAPAAAPAAAPGHASPCDKPDALPAFLATAWSVAPDAITVDGCVAGRFPGAGIAVSASVGTADGESAPRFAVLGEDGAAIARNDGGADKARFDSIGALSGLQAADLDGDGTDELIATETTEYKLSPTTEAVVVYAIKAGKLAPLLRRGYGYVTAEDSEGNEGTALCDGAVAVAGTPPVLTITGKLAAPAAEIKKAKAACVDGVEAYAMKGGALVKR